jgi:hypothetical protein
MSLNFFLTVSLNKFQSNEAKSYTEMIEVEKTKLENLKKEIGKFQDLTKQAETR